MPRVEEPVIAALISGLRKVREDGGPDPKAGSPAQAAEKVFPRPESIRTAFSHGILATEAAADHLSALGVLIVNGNSALPPWTCTRGLLEASAIATWLLDLNIDSVERVGRSLALRYSTLREQRKLANDEGDAATVAAIEVRIDKIAAIAATLGYPEIKDKKGKRIGLGRPKPEISALVEKQFDLKGIYRILSGVAHCDPVTVSQLGFDTLGPSSSGGVIKALAVNPEAMRLLLAKGVDLYARSAWPHIVQYGYDRGLAAALLDEAYTGVGLADRKDVRFWK